MKMPEQTHWLIQLSAQGKVHPVSSLHDKWAAEAGIQWGNCVLSWNVPTDENKAQLVSVKLLLSSVN